MKSLHEGQLVTITGEGPTLDGIVFHTPSLLKAVVAVPDDELGAVLRTVHRTTLTERTEAGEHDEALRRLIRRTPSTGRGGHGAGKAGGHGQRGFTRAPSHRSTGR
jgi:hypothetical protein